MFNDIQDKQAKSMRLNRWENITRKLIGFVAGGRGAGHQIRALGKNFGARQSNASEWHAARVG